MKNKGVFFLVAAVLSFAALIGTVSAQSLDAGSDRLGFSMVVQNGHANTVNAVRFSPDGKYLASGGGFPLAGNFTGDCSVKVTRVSDGIILKNLSGHEANVNALAFSPDGSLLASVSTDRTLRIWRLQTGMADFVSPEAEASLTAVCFSPDGRYAAALGQGASYEENPAAPEIRIYDIKAGKLSSSFRGPSKGVRGIRYTADGSGLLLMYDEKAEIWSPSSAMVTRSLPACGPVAEKDGYFIFLKRSGPDSYDVVRAPVSGGSIVPVGTLSSAGYPLSVSPDGGKYLFFPGENYRAPNEDSRFPILLIDQAGGGKKRSILGHRNYVLTGDFSPDGSLCATGGSEFDGSVRVHSAETGETLLTMRGNTAPLHWVGASNQTLFAGSIISDVLYRWNLGELRLERVMPGTLAAAVAGDGSHVLYRGGGGLKKDRVDTGRSAAEFAGVGTGYEMGLSADGNLMAFPVQDGAQLFDARTGKALRSLSSGRSGFRTEHLAMSPDGLRLAAAGADGSVQVFDCGLGKVTAGYEVRASAVSFSWDSRYLIVGDYDGDVYLKDIQTGKGCSLHRHTEAVRAIASSPSWPGIFVTGSTDRTIRVWQMREQGNLDAGFNVQTLSGHGGAVTSLSFTPDAGYLVSASDDGVVRVWNTKTWEAVNLLALSNGEWIVYTDDGYFDASASGGEYLAMVRGMTPYRVDQFALYANRPDIILSRMGLGSEDQIRHFKALYEKRISKSSLMFKSLTGREVLPGREEAPRAEILSLGVQINTASLTARFSDTGGIGSGIARYNVYVNDVPLFGGFGREIPANAKKDGGWITVEERFPLVSMRNKIEVSCYNDKGIESLRAVRYAEGSGDIAGALYFLGIGVSEYADPAIEDLGFAHKDALDLASLFSGMEGYFSSVHVKTLTNAEATRSALVSAKAFIAGAKPEDVFVLFIAGHGMHDDTQDAAYYFLTHDARLDNLSATAADFETVEDLLQGIKPRRKLFLMDTCESGERYPEDIREAAFIDSAGFFARGIGLVQKEKAPDASDPLAKTPRPYLMERNRYIHNDIVRRSGAVVISSCSGREFSLEDPEKRQGLFTFEVLAALGGKRGADSDGDFFVSAKELEHTVRSTVPFVSGGRQHPAVDRDNLFISIRFPLLKADEIEPGYEIEKRAVGGDHYLWAGASPSGDGDDKAGTASDARMYSLPDRSLDTFLKPDAFVLVEGGSFTMGSRDANYSDSSPQHTVRLSSYYIEKYETTIIEWNYFYGLHARESSYPLDRPVEAIWGEAVAYCNYRSLAEGLNPVYIYAGRGRFPWDWPDDYVEKAHKKIRADFSADGYRLPTEAEWEYAARGGKYSQGFQFSGSGDPAAVGWYEDRNQSFDEKGVKPVGLKQPNELGLFDMSGNAEEWCHDKYKAYTPFPARNPRGALFSKSRVVRGGNGIRDNRYPVYARFSVDPTSVFNSFGFRIVRRAD